MNELTLKTSPNLHVGDCVPFYFCPRSVMLYMFHRGNHPEVNYTGGQEPIVHLEADLNTVVTWAKANAIRWAFTASNAGSRYFQDYNDLAQLNEINWDVINSNYWSNSTDEKQAEFLIELRFPWHLVQRIGVNNSNVLTQASNLLQNSSYIPKIEVIPNWYY